MRGRIALAAVTAGLVAATAGCGGGSGGGNSRATASHELTGTLTIKAFASGDDPCTQGPSGYSDIQDGAQVTVTDGQKILALGTLDGGHLQRDATVGPGNCAFAFTVPNVPDAQFYTVSVAHRGGVSYSLADLKAKNFAVDLTLGG